MTKSIFALAAVALLASPSVLAQSTGGAASTTTGAAASASGPANGGIVATSTGVSAVNGPASSTGFEAIPEAADLTGSNGQSQTFCQKYATALFTKDTADTEQQLMTAVVSRAVLGNQTATNPAVPGILAPGSPTLPYFTGQIKFKSNPTNYTQSYQQTGFNATGEFGQLALKLVTFFGYGFGCNAAGFPGLAGTPNMTLVHESMNIDWPTMQYFDQQLALTLLSYGVSQQDIDSVAVPYLYQFNRYPSLHDGTVFPEGSYGAGQMNGYPLTENEICSTASCPVAPPAYSFCEKYTAALYGTVNATYEQELITAVVARAVLGGQGNGVTVQGIVGPGSPLIPFFNSSIQYKPNPPNFIASYEQHGFNTSYAFGQLATGLVEYFGMDVLGCKEPGFPQYTGANMQTVHANMPIDNNDESYFVTQITQAAVSYGVSQQDANLLMEALKTNLRGDNGNEVCNQADCPCQPGLTANSNGQCTGTPTGPQVPTNSGSNTNSNSGSTGSNNNNNNGGKTNGAAMISPSVGGMIAAVVTAAVALLL